MTKPTVVFATSNLCVSDKETIDNAQKIWCIRSVPQDSPVTGQHFVLLKDAPSVQILVQAQSVRHNPIRQRKQAPKVRWKHNPFRR